MSVWERRKRDLDEEIERQSGASPAAARRFAEDNVNSDADERIRRARKREADAKQNGKRPLMTEEEKDRFGNMLRRFFK